MGWRGYLRPHIADIPPSVFFGNYLQTYVKHDVAGYIDALGIPEEGRGVVMRSDESHVVNGIKYWSAHDWLMR